MGIIKAFTDFEQSKKLVEILPLESADMHYKVDRFTNDYKILIIPYSELGFFKDNDYEYCVPCWSLAALIEFLPDYIVIDKHRWGFINKKKQYFISWVYDMGWTIKYISSK